MFADYLLNPWIAATLVAVVAGVVGFFVVARGAAFAAHALPLGAFPGAAAAHLLGVDPLYGLLAFSGLGALTLSAFERTARRDAATALTLVALLALGAFLLSRTEAYHQAVFALLFGEPLGVARADLAPLLALGLLCVALILVGFRPLLLTSLHPELGQAAGLSPRALDVAFQIVLALASAIALPVVGALLTFSLTVGPAAGARAFAAEPLRALGLSVAFAVATAWLALALAIASDLPVGFFVGALSALAYAAGRAWTLRKRGTRLEISDRIA